MANAPRERFTWQLRTRTLALGHRTRIMGIVNVTPDSFSDGGQFLSTGAALKHALRLLDEGADILDIGGESTRPGAAAGTAEAISAAEEQRRILPVIEAILHERPGTILSIDTYRAATAREALNRGAEIVNDVSGMLWDKGMAGVCAETRCGIIAMHTRGIPSVWATQPRLQPEEVLPLILASLQSTTTQLLQAGCEQENITLDPGFGFGKRENENWTLLREFSRLQTLGFPLLAGLSRKGFLRTTASMHQDEVDQATAIGNAIAALAGAHIVRVHNVIATARALAVADATSTAPIERSC